MEEKGGHDGLRAYALSIQNRMGPEGIQQLALVLLPGFRLVKSSEPPALRERAGEHEVILWQKHVRQGENYRVDVVIRNG